MDWSAQGFQAGCQDRACALPGMAQLASPLTS